MMASKEPLSGPDAAARRSGVQQFIFAAVFAALIFAATFALPHLDTPALRWAVTAVPAGVLLIWGWAMFAALRHADEMMKALFLRAFAIAGLTVLTAATAWGIFEKMLGAPDFPAFLLLPAFSMIYGFVMMAQRPRG